MAEDDADNGDLVVQLDPSQLLVVPVDRVTQLRNAAFSAAVLAAAAPAAVPVAKPVKPGVERWPVKTGTDHDVGLVGKNEFLGPDSNGVVETTVEELIKIPRPAEMSDIHGFQEDFQDRRATPVEFIIWRLKADITVIKKESDGDLHIVLEGDSGRTMIAEAPTPRPPFVGKKSPWLKAMKEARSRIAEHFGPSFAAASFQPLDGKFLVPTSPISAPTAAPPPAVAPGGLIVTPPGGAEALEELPPFEAKVPRTRVTITGVGFFDRVHGQTGVALNNGIELHPILAIDFE